MTKVERIAITLLAIITAFTFIFWKDVTAVTTGETKLSNTGFFKDDDIKKKQKKPKQEKLESTHPNVKIIQRWDMPDDLKEISGIAYIKNNRFACVQDELGKIFVFNTVSGKVEREIQFGDAGDYEGIALANETAYIVRADGMLFEVNNYADGKPLLVQHKTHLTAKQNVEGLCYDKKNNRLLFAIKGKEPNNNSYKGIYAFDLASKKMATTPALKVDLTHNIWNDVKSKNKIQPSDLDVHPLTGDIYIVDGADPKLLVMGADGTKKNLYQLSSSDFPQPEGMSFTNEGDLYISNEGRTGAGNILKVSVDN